MLKMPGGAMPRLRLHWMGALSGIESLNRLSYSSVTRLLEQAAILKEREFYAERRPSDHEEAGE